MKKPWYSDPRLNGREIRFLLLLIELKSSSAEDEIPLTREFVCEQLGWGTLAAVSQVSASLVSKKWLIKKQGGKTTFYSLTEQFRGVRSCERFAIENGSLLRTVTPLLDINNTQTNISRTTTKPKGPKTAPVVKSNAQKKKPTAEQLLTQVEFPACLLNIEGYQELFSDYIHFRQRANGKTLYEPKQVQRLLNNALVKYREGIDVLAALDKAYSSSYSSIHYPEARPANNRFVRRGDQRDAVDDFIRERYEHPTQVNPYVS